MKRGWSVAGWLFAIGLLLVVTTGCEWFKPVPTLVATLTASPPATLTATPTATFVPTFTPTATPTSTPIPPVRVQIEFPKPVTALEPVTWRVLIEEPQDINAHVSARARIIDAQDQLYATFDMVRGDREGWWMPEAPLQLPLEPQPYPGVWHVIVDVEAALPIRGYRDRVFTPQRVPNRVLTDTIPGGVRFRVPQAFSQIAAQGDLIAGFRVWDYRDCQIGLAWAPGPTEELLIDNALVMVEATFPQDEPQVEINLDLTKELLWGQQEWTAFLFYENWKSETASTPAESLVIQGPNFMLYALRIRAEAEREIHSLCRDVGATLDFVEQ